MFSFSFGKTSLGFVLPSSLALTPQRGKPFSSTSSPFLLGWLALPGNGCKRPERRLRHSPSHCKSSLPILSPPLQLQRINANNSLFPISPFNVYHLAGVLCLPACLLACLCLCVLECLQNNSCMHDFMVLNHWPHSKSPQTCIHLSAQNNPVVISKGTLKCLVTEVSVVSPHRGCK